MWDLWCKKWHWGRFEIGKILANVPSGLNPTPFVAQGCLFVLTAYGPEVSARKANSHGTH
jgi:hypothetical protein